MLGRVTTGLRVPFKHTSTFGHEISWSRRRKHYQSIPFESATATRAEQSAAAVPEPICKLNVNGGLSNKQSALTGVTGCCNGRAGCGRVQATCPDQNERLEEVVDHLLSLDCSDCSHCERSELEEAKICKLKDQIARDGGQL